MQLLGICPFYTDVVSSSVYVLRTISCLSLLGTEESNFQEWSGCFCRTAVHAYCTWFTNVIFGNATVAISRSPVFTFKWLVPCGHSLGWETFKGPLPIHNKDAILWMEFWSTGALAPEHADWCSSQWIMLSGSWIKFAFPCGTVAWSCKDNVFAYSSF